MPVEALQEYYKQLQAALKDAGIPESELDPSDELETKAEGPSATPPELESEVTDTDDSLLGEFGPELSCFAMCFQVITFISCRYAS